MKIHIEVFIGSRILGTDQSTFTPEDLKRFILKEFGDARSGISTHISASCVANAPLNHAVGYNYLWRMDNGLFRIFRPGQDLPKPERLKYRTRPEMIDVPDKYRYLLQGE